MYYTDNQGNRVPISEADQRWLNDSWFHTQQLKLPTDAPRAALTYRVSTKGQVDHDDIPLQKIECRKFAQNHGWRVVAEEAEKGISGSKVSASKRDVIQKLREEAEKKNFDILLVYMFDRLGRIDSETPFVLEWFVNHGVQMWSTHEGQQRIENHADKLMNYIRFWQAAGESDKTSMRTRDRLRQIVSSGHYTGGFVPYGYRIVEKGRVNKREQAVKDLEINEDEAVWVREIFERAANEGASGYYLAKVLNERGLRTRQGAKFQANNVLRIIRHEGYTGYIITKSARSEYIPELQIVDKELFQRANEMVSRRSTKLEEAKRLASQSDNPTLLAGIVRCAHCGAKMSAFLHTDRYKLADGTVREKVQPKYNCYQRGQKLKDCDGQSLYLAQRVDDVVLEVVHEMFTRIRTNPYDATAERRVRQMEQEQRRQKQEAEKKLKAIQHRLEGYEDEVIRVIDGTSKFSDEMLARLIARTEAELQQEKQNYEELCRGLQTKETVSDIRTYYRDFLGWANEFVCASLPRKRAILSQLLDSVDVGRGYKIIIHMNVNYEQFLHPDTQEEFCTADICAGG